jgi:hypothetical protein
MGYMSTVSTLTNPARNLKLDVTASNLQFASTNVRFFNCLSNGLIGINTHQTTPGANLDVSGNVLVRGPGKVYVTAGGSMGVNKPYNSVLDGVFDVSGVAVATTLVVRNSGHFGGDVYTNTIWSPSDSNWKSDIRTYIPKPLELESIRGVRYTWKKTGKEDIGFIAQELREQIPEAVKENEKGDLHIDSTKLLPLLVESIKELKTEVGTLKVRISTLESRCTC